MVDKIICVGKNYLEHARELGDVIPDKPVLFLKPASVMVDVLTPGETVFVKFPDGRGAVHYECEIVFRLKAMPHAIQAQDAKQFVSGVTLGLDMTLRDEQEKLKKNGHPWEKAKVFSSSAIVGPWLTGEKSFEILDKTFELFINDELKQRGQAREMTLSWSECIAYASEYFPILEGDLLFTGTPAGVGTLEKNVVAELKWDTQSMCKIVRQ